ncbi:MAG TPA: hypothetical protein VF831_04440 [Anaerolineales bacterium]
MHANIPYSIVTRMISDPAYLQDVSSHPDDVFQKEGLADQDQIEELKDLSAKLTDLYNPSYDATSRVWKQYYDRQLLSSVKAIEAFRKGLCETIAQIENGFHLTSIMYNVAFYLGVGLIVFSMIYAVATKGSLLSLAFGGFGILDIIMFFITKPPQDLQSSRADLAQLQLAYYNWFLDNYGWNWYVGSLWDWGRDDFIRDRMKEASAILLSNTDKTMALIEKYCEFSKEKKPHPENQEPAEITSE